MSMFRGSFLQPPVRSAALVGLALLSDPAAAMTFNPHRLAAADIARVSEICELVVRVAPGELHFYNCVDSLSHSLRSASRSPVTAPVSLEAQGGPASYYTASLTVAGRREQVACVDVGLDEKAPDFAACVADLGQSLRRADVPPIN